LFCCCVLSYGLLFGFVCVLCLYSWRVRQARLNGLLSDVSELLYDEMLFANMVAKQSAQHEQMCVVLQRQAQMVESRLGQLR
jgi:hypothetical protein